MNPRSKFLCQVGLPARQSSGLPEVSMAFLRRTSRRSQISKRSLSSEFLLAPRGKYRLLPLPSMVQLEPLARWPVEPSTSMSLRAFVPMKKRLGHYPNSQANCARSVSRSGVGWAASRPLLRGFPVAHQVRWVARLNFPRTRRLLSQPTWTPNGFRPGRAPA